MRRRGEVRLGAALVLAAVCTVGTASADEVTAKRLSAAICTLTEPRPVMKRPSAKDSPKTGMSPALLAAAQDVLREAGPIERGARHAMGCADLLGDDVVPMSWTVMAPAALRVDGDALIVVGYVDADLPGRLAETLDAHPEIGRVALLSPGGYIEAGFAAGRIVRRRKLETTLAGGCWSACTLIHLGGIRRHRPPGTARLGYHMSASEAGEAVMRYGSANLASLLFANAMGVDGAAFVGLALRAPPEGMVFPNRAELCALGVITDPCAPPVDDLPPAGAR